MSRKRLLASLPYAALFVLGGVFTAWWIASARIPRSADQAVVALMARHILEGRGHPVFYWGATYGGTLEPHLLAPVFGLFGATPAAFRAFYVALWALFAAGTAAYTARFFGRRAGLLAAAYLAIPPFFLPYKVLTSDGAYASVALLGLAVLWLATDADSRLEKGRGADATLALLGFAAGVGVWVTPVTLPVATVAVAWLLARPGRRPGVQAFAACAAGALVGAAPSLVWNLRHAGQSVRARELAPASGAGLISNLTGFFGGSLPVLLGAARPNFNEATEPSFPGAFIVVPFVAGLLLVPALLAVRRDRRLRLLLAVFAVLAAATILVARRAPREPRYMVAAYAAFVPLLAASLAGASSGLPRAAAAAGFALLLMSDLSGAVRARRHIEDANDAQVTGPLEPLLTELRARGITRLWTNYWAAYRITFESGGVILAAPVALEDANRVATIQDAVRTSPDPAVVLLPPRDACFRTALIEHAEPYSESRSGAFAIFHGLPESIRDVARSGALPMPVAAYRPTWGAAELPVRLAPGGEAGGSAHVTNTGPCTWMNNVRLVVSWNGPETREAAFSTPDRRVAPGETADLTFRLRAPQTAGDYRLRLDLDQSGIARFSAKGGATLDARVLVAP
ncbi:MAG: hypothetical protein PT977_14575 [Acidobacteriota bacterium]|nr:hypothetical protein [Acidobacteriota bacterium]